MVTKVFLSALGANFVFLVTGCAVLGFALIARSQMFNPPGDGEDAIRSLLYQRMPLTAIIINAVFILTTSFFTLAGLISPIRGLLKTGGYLVVGSGLFTLCVGVAVWIMTLRFKDDFFPTYVALETSSQKLVQQSFHCCGYYNSTTPAFVTDQTCFSPAAAALARGCATFISAFGTSIIDTVFTAFFGVVGINVVLVLAIACLLKERKERLRYRHIDQKSGYRSF